MNENLRIAFVGPESEDFIYLANKLDEYYFEVVGAVQARYADANHPKNFDRRAIVYDGERPVACGCWKAHDAREGELKRIYVLPEYRRTGVATLLVKKLEADMAAAGHSYIILETARTTPPSAAFYRYMGYTERDYYGSPAGAENCLCFEKTLG